MPHTYYIMFPDSANGYRRAYRWLKQYYLEDTIPKCRKKDKSKVIDFANKKYNHMVTKYGRGAINLMNKKGINIKREKCLIIRPVNND